MRRFFRLAGWTGATLFAASLIGAVVILAVVSHAQPDMTLNLGHDQVVVGDLDAGHAVMAFGAIALGLFVVLTVVPLSLVFATAVTAGALALTLAIVLALAAWVASPILLLIGLAWWLLRRRKAARVAPLPDGGSQQA